MAKKKRSTGPLAPAADLGYILESLRGLAVPLAELEPDPRNARTHDERNLKSIAASLRQFGQLKPIVVNRKTHIIEAGNGTFEAARRLGWTHLAAVYVQHDAKAALGFSLADNRTSDLAAWDDAVLLELLPQVADDSPDLYADLLLAELREAEPAGDGDQSGADHSAQLVPDQFSVVVECRDEADQKRFYETTKKEGRACRLLTL